MRNKMEGAIGVGGGRRGWEQAVIWAQTPRSPSRQGTRYLLQAVGRNGVLLFRLGLRGVSFVESFAFLKRRES